MPVTQAEVGTRIQPDIFHRCICLKCSVTLATKAEECVCCEVIDRIDEMMRAVNQDGDCVTLYQDVSLNQLL